MSTPCMRVPAWVPFLVCHGSGFDDGARLSSVAVLNRAAVTYMNRADFYRTTEALFKFLSQKGKATLISEKVITDHLAQAW